MAICTTKTAILSGGEEVVPVDRHVHGVRPGVDHGHQTVVRVGHGAQALLQLVALAALRPGSPDRFRAAADDAAPNDTAAAAAAAAIKASCAAAAAEDAAAAAVRLHGRRLAAERELARRDGRRRRRRPCDRRRRRRRFRDQRGRQAHAVYLNQRRIYSFARA